ncbi:hypothetical protein EXIGLDRAFT_419634 [Exidia glandulosa HHB12029]|uniref:Uncharacterized protein n=1 Tax=Exidia glandulosa HHB12029 TaxID=1314781 RepID=A0A165PV27_EXIGL|nr:hypothetical protein EXIGLDRAFT_419634 [Exidia glandulosa HHB12029]
MRAGASPPQPCNRTRHIHMNSCGLHACAACSSLRTIVASPTLKGTHARLGYRAIRARESPPYFACTVPRKAYTSATRTHRPRVPFLVTAFSTPSSSRPTQDACAVTRRVSFNNDATKYVRTSP